MINIFLELERLRGILIAKGYDGSQIELILLQAENEINSKLRQRLDYALDTAVELGVQKDSPEFINDLRPNSDAFRMETESSVTDFSEPPKPTLDMLLARSAKPIKDGSGVYKVIPVGGKSGAQKPKIHTNIFDAQKAAMAERHENAAAQYKNIAPKASKINFRTATSKQNRNTQWVKPAKEKDFTSELQNINSQLSNDKEDIILEVIRSFEEGF